MSKGKQEQPLMFGWVTAVSSVGPKGGGPK
jgi:hypothetical protein